MNNSFVDLFCGAGGLSLGLQRAGWQPLLAVDNWDDAVLSYRRNFSSHPVLLKNVSDLLPKELEKLLDHSPDWIVGGPPCQGFSTVGKREKTDPRNQMVHQFARIVEITKPQSFLIENVLGLRDMDFVASISDLFDQLGYGVTTMILTSADYGVPQLRRRVIFVGDQSRRSFMPPEPSHPVHEYVTVWSAIGDLPELKPGDSATEYDREPFTDYQTIMRVGSKSIQGHQASRHPEALVKAISHIPDGGNRRQIPQFLQPRSGYHNSYSRLHSGSPAVAVTQNMGKPSGTRCIHPFQHRGLTAREGARLQSFPDIFHFEGGVTSQRLQIANAVPPLLAQSIGLALTNQSHWHETQSTFDLELLVRESVEVA